MQSTLVRILGALFVLGLCAGAAQTQTKLTTLFAGNNGSITGGIVYFDVTVKRGAVIISSLETNCDKAANTPIGLDVYTCPTSYVGQTGNRSAWTQVATDDGSAVSAGSGDVPSLVQLQKAFTLPPGKHGMALVAKGFGHDFTNGSATNNVAEDNALRLDLGAADHVPFYSATPYSPRVWNGSILYDVAAGLYANFEATPLEGQSPLQVQFRDRSYSSDPGGVTRWEWDFDNDQVIDSTLQNPQFVFTGQGYDLRHSVSLKVTDASHGSSTETKRDYIVLNPFPTASATSFGQGSKVPTSSDPIRMPEYQQTYSYPQSVRGFYAQAPVNFTITAFAVPNEQNASHQSVWFFLCTRGQPSVSYRYYVMTAETLFLGTGPVGSPLTPASPIVVQKDQWFGCLAACHDAKATVMHSSYGNEETVSVLNHAMPLKRLQMEEDLVGHSGTGYVYVSGGSIGRVLMTVQGNAVAPNLGASGDTPFFGGTPRLDLRSYMSRADVGLLFGSLGTLPGTGAASPFGRILIDPSSFWISFALAGGEGSVPLGIPRDTSLADAHLYWQAYVLDLKNGVYGTSNGIDWRIGRQ
jgi:PKD repeat protein